MYMKSVAIRLLVNTNKYDIWQTFISDRLYRAAAVLGIHKKVVVATVQVEGISKETRTFYTFTSSLTQMREWLVSLGVTHVAMESTGYIGNRYTTCSRISSATSGLSMPVTSRMFRVTRQTRTTVSGYANC